MKKLILSLLLITGAFTVSAQKYNTEIKSLPGERWFGGYTAKGYCETPIEEAVMHPYEKNVPKRDLEKMNYANQAAPFLLSTMGRYVWSEQPFVFEFRDGDLYLYSDFEKLNVVQAGNTLRSAYVAAKDKYFPPSGKTPEKLMFTMPQYNTWIELGKNQNQKDILNYADNVLKNNFPVGVFMIDDQWTYHNGKFVFDHIKFPDPKGMVDELHRKGFKVMLWMTPFISPDTEEFEETNGKKYLVYVKNSTKPAILKWWNGYSAVLDLTNPEAVGWFRNKLKGLQDKYGIDGFKFDAVDYDFYYQEDLNTTGPEQSEAYARFGMEFKFNELRSTWKTANQPIAQRLQDKKYSWDDMTLLIPDMVSAGLIGHPFTCPDMIGGGLIAFFKDLDYKKFDQTMMIRSAQVQTLMPMMQFSVAPWRVLDKEHLAICRDYANMHSQKGEFIYSLAQQAARDGEPIVRHMEYMFPHEGFETCTDQYMFGEKLLIAPMVTPGITREVKLPKGNWKDEQGKKYKGGKTYIISVPLNRLPVFEFQK